MQRGQGAGPVVLVHCHARQHGPVEAQKAHWRVKARETGRHRKRKRGAGALQLGLGQLQQTPDFGQPRLVAHERARVQVILHVQADAVFALHI